MAQRIFGFLLTSIMFMTGCTTTTVELSHDFDGDGVIDPDDNCSVLDNPEQEDADGDLIGDVCDPDRDTAEGDLDGDGVTDSEDNCVALDNEMQQDLDLDGLGDVCDEDDDGDGVPDLMMLGDLDGDSIDDGRDNCVALDNPTQENWDGDALGDVCDEDDDGDGIFDAVDNCQFVANADQTDTDTDFVGDLCDATDNLACPDFVSAHECGGGWALCEPEGLATVTVSHLVTAWDGGPAIYWYAADGRRYVFPNVATFQSWFPTTGECPVIRRVSNVDLASILIGGNVTVRPGTRLVKITTDPRVYAITRGGVLHWIQSEALASAVYGTNWRRELLDVPDSFFVNYSVGTSIDAVSDYNRFDVFAGTDTIDQDLGLVP